MKKRKSMLLFLLVAVFVSALPMHYAMAAEQIVSLAVDLNTVIKPSTDLLLGTNEDWSDKPIEHIYKNSESDEVSEDYITFWGSNAIPLANVRKGGGTSNSYDWMSLVGPRENRVSNPYATNLGLSEVIKSTLEVNPKAAFTAVINLNDAPEKSGDLVRYLTLSPDDANATNPTTGINWAQVRVDDGIKNPVNIIAFELGNELYWEYCKKTDAHPWNKANQANVTTAAKMYTDLCKPVISAMRGVNPDVKISAISNSGAEIDGAFAPTEWWNSKVIEELGDYCGGVCDGGCGGNCFGRGINFVTHHDYYFFNSTDAENSKSGHSNASAKDTSARISKFFNGRDIKIMITEQNMLFSDTMTKEEFDSHSYALRIADYLNSAYNVPEIYSANHHGFLANGFTSFWGVGRLFAEDGKYYPTPAGLVLALMNEAVGGDVVKTTVNSGKIAGKDDAVITSAHLKPDGRLDLVILNRNETTAKNVSVNINNSNVTYNLESVSLLSGSADANNTPKSPEKSKITRTLINATEKFANYTVPACSMVLLHLVPEDFAKIEDETGKITVEKYKNVLRVTDKIYAQKGLYNKSMTAIVLKTGASAEEYSFEDICAFGQTTVGQDIAYFEIPLPADFENGDHDIIISGDGIYHYTTYNCGLIEDIVFENADGKNYVSDGKEYPEISDNDYKIDITAVFNDDISEDAIVGATVVYGDSEDVELYSDKNIYRVAYAAQSTVADGKLSVYMPQSALSCVYTVIIGVNADGEASRKTKSFYFAKPDEEIMLISPPHTANGEDISLITDLSETVFVDLKQLKEDLSAKVFIGYYNNGKLISASADDVDLKNGETVTAQLKATATSETADSAKLFIWQSDSNQPLMRAYAIK